MGMTQIMCLLTLVATSAMYPIGGLPGKDAPVRQQVACCCLLSFLGAACAVNSCATSCSRLCSRTPDAARRSHSVGMLEDGRSTHPKEHKRWLPCLSLSRRR